MSANGRLGMYQCSGLTVVSEIPLSAPDSKLDDPAHADVTVVMGAEVQPPFERPSSEVVAELIVEDYLCYTICRVGDGYVARLPWIADFVISGDLTHVVCHPVTLGRPEVIPIILPGTIVAFLLTMRGQCVLHGSAVDLGGTALAFVGASGQGKSTMAAILCAAGASLITDDVLPLDFGTEGYSDAADGVYSLRSGEEIRLREKAASLARRFEDHAVRMTEDERLAVSPIPSPSERLPLSAIVLPRPDREHREVTSRHLAAGEASLALGRCQRIEGWRDRAHLRRQFVDVGRIVASVPVFEVMVPWGPPFGLDLAEQVLDACRLENTAALPSTPDRDGPVGSPVGH